MRVYKNHALAALRRDREHAVQPTFSKIFLKFAQIFEIFYHFPFSSKARSIAEHCRWKRGVK
jgi:hypothetical protein